MGQGHGSAATVSKGRPIRFEINRIDVATPNCRLRMRNILIGETEPVNWRNGVRCPVPDKSPLVTENAETVQRRFPKGAAGKQQRRGEHRAVGRVRIVLGFHTERFVAADFG